MMGPRIALAIALCASSGCSLVLDFDKPVDAAPPDSRASPDQCARGEPNDTPLAATPWMVGDGDIDAGICGGGDRDYYKLTIIDGQSIAATITFMNRNGDGDLDLRLLSADGGTLFEESRGSSDTETVMCPGGQPCPALVAGDYVLEIQGFAPSVVEPYLLQITIAP